MNKTLAAILGILALVMAPAMTMAKSHTEKPLSNQGGTKGPTPNPSAVEHADENAKFLRDSHDMGKHEGQEGHDDKDKDKDKSKNKDKAEVDDKGSVKDKEKSKDQAKAKGKGKDSADKGKGKPVEGKDKGKDKGAQTDADKLLEQARKPKGEKAK